MAALPALEPRVWGHPGTWSPGRLPGHPDMFVQGSLVAVHLEELPGPAPRGLARPWFGRALGRRPAGRRRPIDRQPPPSRPSCGGGGRDLRPEALLGWWNQAATRLEQPARRGPVEPLPNVVFVGAEDRLLTPVEDDLFELAPEEAFRWLAHYEPAAESAVTWRTRWPFFAGGRSSSLPRNRRAAPQRLAGRAAHQAVRTRRSAVPSSA